MSHSVPTEKTNIPSSSALWAVLIFVGLIIAAVNFVKAESAPEEGHGGHGAATEHVEHGAASHEHATTEEHGTATAEEHATTEAATTDTAHHEAHATEEAHH